jgi:hypothetical protein
MFKLQCYLFYEQLIVKLFNYLKQIMYVVWPMAFDPKCELMAQLICCLIT